MAAFGGRDMEYNSGYPYTSPVGSFPDGSVALRRARHGGKRLPVVRGLVG